jgi:hypothetical protein
LMNCVIAVAWADEPCPDNVPLAHVMAPPAPEADDDDEDPAEELDEPPAAELVVVDEPEPDGELLSEPQAVSEARATASTPAPTAALRP